MHRLLPCLLVTVAVSLSGCGGASQAPTADAAAARTAVPDIALPAGELRELVPATADLPPGMVPILSGSGPRDAASIAAYSADPAAARTLLGTHGFQAAYTGQYADPQTGRVLSVVVTRFATAAGATADLHADLAASAGDLIATTKVGQEWQVRRQPLPAPTASPAGSPATPGELITVRFRAGALTWLVAYGATPTAQVDVAVDVALRLVARAPTAS